MRRFFLPLACVALLWATPAVAAAPAIGSQNFLRASVSATPITLSNVDAGAGVLVMVLQSSSNARTYSVADDAGGTYTELTAARTGGAASFDCSARCVDAWLLTSSAGGAPLTITVTQSSTLAGYAIYVAEINCPTACAYDTGSHFENTTAGGVTMSLTSADSTVIDTASDVFVSSFCVAAGLGTVTAKTGWTAYSEPSSDSPSGAQYVSTAAALTDERGEITHTNLSNSMCGIVSVKNTAAATGGVSLLLMGVGR